MLESGDPSRGRQVGVCGVCAEPHVVLGWFMGLRAAQNAQHCVFAGAGLEVLSAGFP